MLGCAGANIASFRILNEVNQSRPESEQIAWWGRNFLFKVWEPHRALLPNSPLRKYVIALGLLMLVGLLGTFITLPVASSANAR
jgi:hypothetical protein